MAGYLSEVMHAYMIEQVVFSLGMSKGFWTTILTVIVVVQGATAGQSLCSTV